MILWALNADGWLRGRYQSDRPAGIRYPFLIQRLRHTFATRLNQKTGDLYLVQRALGHRQITTTEVYARVSDERLRRALA